MKLAFDISSFLKTALYGSKDLEHGRAVQHEGKEVWVNSAWHGYDRALPRMIEVMQEYGLTPIDCILAVEGANSKGKRLMIDSQYKATRESSAPESNEEFHKLKDLMVETWLGLGAIVLTQDLAEGDDTLAWLALHTEEPLAIATFDNDLSALNTQANPQGVEIEVWVDGIAGMNKYGLFDCHLITTYKALVGDGKEYKGCPNFGEKAFEKLFAEYGQDGIQELHNMLMAGNLAELDELCLHDKNKELHKINDNRAQVQRCFELAKLRPEWVDTMQHPLQWQIGMPRQVRKDDDPKLKPYYGRARLVTADNFADAAVWFLEKLADTKSVALDFETTTPDESDEWLAAQPGKVESIDVFGSTLCGMGLTFGNNNQFTLYFSMNHADTANIDPESVRALVAQIPQDIPLIIHSTSFELVVAFNAWAAKQADNGYHGFLPNVMDTKIEANYVDENRPQGLKFRSKLHLGYTQQTYDEVTTLTGHPDELPRGGRLVSENYKHEMRATGKMIPDPDNPGSEDLVEEFKMVLVEEPTGEIAIVTKGKKQVEVPVMAPVLESITRKYKMHELSAKQVFGYGADDPICTAALHNFFKLHMQLDHHWQVYLDVEILPLYQHAKNFIDGMPISLEEMNEQADADTKIYDREWKVLRNYLIEKGWDGTTPPQYGADITVAQIKEAFKIRTDRPLDTMMRTMSKLVTFIREVEEEPVFAALLERMVDPEVQDKKMKQMYADNFNKYIQEKFTGEPDFNDGSTTQMANLLYKVMELPVRVRNKPTDQMKAKGIYEGNPKTDALAIAYAERDAAEELKPVLTALRLMGMVGTRRSLYYNKYPYFPHWKDGLVRSQHNQTSTNTRRASSSNPNVQQLPKHPKMEGYDAKFRAVVRPHKPGALVVSIDFDSQEMRVIGEVSGDKTVLSMFIGDNLTGPHSLTGLAIAMRKKPEFAWSYEVFEDARQNKGHSEFVFAKSCRVLGKKLNFVAEYGAMAAKVAATLLIEEDEAQLLLDAREAMYPEVVTWKKKTIADAKRTGKSYTLKGAVRHLREAFTSTDRFESSKAERQSVNFVIQSSSGEMTKEAEGRMWKDNLYFDFDAVCYGPIHDEVVSSCVENQLVSFIQRKHKCMAVQYAGMKVPVLGSISIGLDFYHQVELGTVPTREAIEAGIKQVHAEAAQRAIDKAQKSSQEAALHDDEFVRAA